MPKKIDVESTSLSTSFLMALIIKQVGLNRLSSAVGNQSSLLSSLGMQHCHVRTPSCSMSGLTSAQMSLTSFTRRSASLTTARPISSSAPMSCAHHELVHTLQDRRCSYGT